MPVPEPEIAINRARHDELPEVQRLAAVIWRAHYPAIITHEQIDYMLERGYALATLGRKFERFDDRMTVQVKDQDQRLKKIESGGRRR